MCKSTYLYIYILYIYRKIDVSRLPNPMTTPSPAGARRPHGGGGGMRWPIAVWADPAQAPRTAKGPTSCDMLIRAILPYNA